MKAHPEALRASEVIDARSMSVMICAGLKSTAPGGKYSGFVELSQVLLMCLSKIFVDHSVL
jgi:hypothetical protein